MKPFRGTIAFLTIILVAGQLSYGSMPPHPRVQQMLARGEISRPQMLEHWDKVRSRGIGAAWAAPSLRRDINLQTAPAIRTVGPAQSPTGSYRALVILVDFSDQVSQVASTEFDTLVFDPSDGTPGTLRDYYQEVSYGQLDIVTLNLPGALGWQRAPQTYAYYVDGQFGTDGTYPNNSQRLVEDVVNALDALDEAVDFSQYDNDLDGEVDALFVVHSGPRAEYTGDFNDMWSHAWVTYYTPVLDGVDITHYSIVPEYWLTPGDMTVGVYAHEMGHAVFGLPDLYDYGYDSAGLGSWSLMAGGSWNGNNGDSPAFPDAWSRAKMGYVNPTNVTSDLIGESISAVESTNDVYRLWGAGALGNEYFLVENRQQVGYDEALPGSGLLIYHVDEAVTTDNDNQWYPPDHTTFGHYLVALEQADGLWELEKSYTAQADIGDPYPGSTTNTSFSNSSTPSSQDYDGNNTNVAVANISASAMTMTADFLISSVLAVTPDSLWDDDLTVGDTFSLDLIFEKSGTITVEPEVREP